jgi:adenine-specific DNA-methyltransferase
MNFSQPYERAAFLGFLDSFLPGFKRDVRVARLPRGVTAIEEARRLGGSDDLDLSVFEFLQQGSIQRRLSLAADGFRVMKDTASFLALAAYSSADQQEWRLSLMAATPVIDPKGQVVVQLSNPRRQSFALGPAVKVHTPTKYLQQLGPVSSRVDLLSRFSVEVVNSEFYARVAELYTELVGGARLTSGATVTYEGLLRLPGSADNERQRHEFAVRLLGRVLFCWFLREKKGADGRELVPPSVLSLSAAEGSSNYYHLVLEPLFFELLNRRLEARHDHLRSTAFDQIPYLNGGLFSPSPDDFYSTNGSGAPSPSGLVIPDVWIRRLFEVLELYNFTVDESTSTDIDLSIDPEMLGRIFENLLAEINPETGESARKSTGSYYTPRQIVDYMVNASLESYLERTTQVSSAQLRALISDDVTDSDEVVLTPAESDSVIQAIGHLTVLDPACGSGAFPIGYLQRLVQTLRRVDPDAQRWLRLQTQGAPPELRRVIEREFSHRNFDYIRKLGVLRQSVYGVDIQPVATEIARLRCFLTLMVEERVDDSLPNRGIEPLPNLDFKFVAADTLLELSADYRAGQLGLYEDDEGIAELRALRADYFGSTSTERDGLKLKFLQTQKRMLERLLANHAIADVTRRLSSWDPFSHVATGWFDPSWMFGVAAFDVVIGNPPYVNALQFKRTYRPGYRELLNARFASAKGAYDLYVPFIEAGLTFARESGCLAYITPNKYLSATYAKALREHLIKTAELASVVDVSGVRVFEEAAVYPLVSIITKGVAPAYEIQARLPLQRSDGTFDLSQYRTTSHKSALLQSLPDCLWGFLLSPDAWLLPKLLRGTKRLDGLAMVNATSTAAEADEYGQHISDLAGKDALKVVNTGTIDPLRSLWGRKPLRHSGVSYVTPWLSLGAAKVNRRRVAMYRSPKVLVAKMANRCEAFLDDKGEFASINTNCVYAPNGDLSLSYIAAFLNSRVFHFIYVQLFGALRMSGGYFQFQAPQLRVMPIKRAAGDIERAIDDLAAEIASSSGDCHTEWQEIDRMFYEVFELDPGEVAVVERDDMRRSRSAELQS